MNSPRDASPADKALHAYRRERLNCAQSVFRGLEPAGATDGKIAEAAAWGRGNAPGGRCGALHAALELAPPEKREELAGRFAAHAGAEGCDDIRNLKRLSCQGCVELAAKLASDL